MCKSLQLKERKKKRFITWTLLFLQNIPCVNKSVQDYKMANRWREEHSELILSGQPTLVFSELGAFCWISLQVNFYTRRAHLDASFSSSHRGISPGSVEVCLQPGPCRAVLGDVSVHDTFSALEVQLCISIPKYDAIRIWSMTELEWLECF